MTSEMITLGNEIMLYPEVTELVVSNSMPSFSINQIASLGAIFEPMVNVLEQITEGGGSATGLYKVSLPEGATHLASLKNGSGNIGAAFNDNNELIGQAVLNPVALDPVMLFMAVTLANIDNKLGEIQVIQQEMMDFLNQKEKSKLRGSLIFLQDLLEKYKFKWNDNQYKQSVQIKVLDIQQDAHAQIDFYTENIKRQLGKKDIIHIQKDAEKLIHKVQDYLQDLQIAQYLFGFSSFVETLMSGKYDTDYLSRITDQIEAYAYSYRDLYTKAYNYIEKYTGSSLQAHVLGGAAVISKGAGKLLEKVPLISKTQIDENLQKAGSTIERTRARSVDQLMGRLHPHQSSPTKPFVDSINMINIMHNEQYDILVDSERLYLDVNV